MKLILPAFILALMLSPVSLAVSQELQQTPAKQPDTPAPLQEAVDGGAQIYYLGEFAGLNGWSLIREGKPEYFYQTKDKKALVMGILFDEEGEMVTSGQLAQLHANVGDDMYAITGGADTLANPQPVRVPKAAPQITDTTTAGQALTGNATSIVAPRLTKAQEMYVDLRAANWVTFGENGTHEIFAFLDPDCPHCQEFVKSIKPYVDNGSLKVRALPIGLNSESMQRAAVILAAADPFERFLKYSNGDQTVLTPPSNINTTAVENNLNLLLQYKFDVTPIVVYRTNGGEIRIVRGRPQDMDAIFRDIETK